MNEEGEGRVQLDHGKLRGKRESERERATSGEEQLHTREVLWPTPLPDPPLFE